MDSSDDKAFHAPNQDIKLSGREEGVTIECCKLRDDDVVGGVQIRDLGSGDVDNSLICQYIDEDKAPNVLLTLPPEIWSMILDYIPQNDRVKQRLVNKRWCKSIDEWSSFKIVYNLIPKLLREHVFNLRIRACEFSGLKGDSDLEFAHPLFLKEITFGPCVSAEISMKILRQCRNVESLKFFATEKSDTYFKETLNPTGYLKNLKMLKSIELGVLYFGRRSPSSISSTFATLFGCRNLIFPALSEVIIHCNMTKKEWIELMHFLGRHANTIRGLSILQCICDALKYSEESCGDEEPSMANFPTPNLTSFAIMKCTACGCNGELLWSKLLSAKSKVQKLWTNLVPDTSVISDFVEKNQTTLRTMKLYDVALGVEASMNASVFQHCSKLEELSLHFLSCSVIVIKVREPGCESNPITKRYSEFVGLQFLPKSLKKLSITGCDITSSTIMDMSSELVKLQEIYIGDPGSVTRSEYGVTMEVLLCLIKNIKGLHNLVIHNNSLNLMDQEDKNKWTRISNVLRDSGVVDNNSPSRNSLIPTKERISISDGSNPLINLNFNKLEGSRSELVHRLQSEFKRSNIGD